MEIKCSHIKSAIRVFIRQGMADENIIEALSDYDIHIFEIMKIIKEFRKEF